MARFANLALVVLVALALSSQAEAAVIPVANYSFENPYLPNDTAQYLNGGTDDGNIIPDWKIVIPAYRFGGVANLSDGFYLGTTGDVEIPDTGGGTPIGYQSGYLHWGGGTGTGTATITSSAAVTTLEAGLDYTLIVAVGTPLNVGGNLDPRVTNAEVRIIRADTGAIIATTAPTIPTAGNWTDVTTVLSKEAIAAGSLAGVDVKIQLYARMGTTQQRVRMDFDNVRFSDTSVAIPEPATMSLVVLGGVAALLRKRRS